jgi:LuxR family maltose regulon positive regulatory protein
MRTYERGLQLATEHGEPLLRGTADMHVGMSELERERNDLQAATQHLLRSQEQGEHTGFPQNPYRWRVAMARIQQVEGDLAGALDLLDEAERRYVADFSPNVRPVAAFKTRLWVAQGRLGEALGWARAQGLSVEDDLSYLREFEHITQARVLLACSEGDRTDDSLREAIGLLDRLLHAAEAGERTGNVIEILVLQALAHHMRSDIAAALAPLSRALALAEPEGYVRMFVDEGPPMAELLTRLKDEGGRVKEYIHKLLAAFGKQAAVHPSSLIPQPLVEPLSQRELDVLRLFKTELSGPEIAQELVIALSTVRTHTKSIYSKLNVNTRRAAVKRAAELDLL